MKFADAYLKMRNGEKIKRPSWGGYWFWDDNEKTIVIHTKDGDELDIRKTERVEYTTDNIIADDWIIATAENCPQLGGKELMCFGEAIKLLKRDLRVARKGWNGKGMYVMYCGVKGEDYTLDTGEKVKRRDYLYMKAADNTVVPWVASQTDILAEDWYLVDTSKERRLQYLSTEELIEELCLRDEVEIETVNGDDSHDPSTIEVVGPAVVLVVETE